MTIEQRLAEAIRSFHLDSLSSAVPLNVRARADVICQAAFMDAEGGRIRRLPPPS